MFHHYQAVRWCFLFLVGHTLLFSTISGVTVGDCCVLFSWSIRHHSHSFKVSGTRKTLYTMSFSFGIIWIFLLKEKLLMLRLRLPR